MKREPFISTDIAVLLISLITTFAVWEISVNFPREEAPVIVFVIGIAASFMLFAMVYALGRSARKESDFAVEHARLIAAIESVPIGMIVVDTKGDVVLSNSELSRILGEAGGKWTLAKIEEILENVYSIRRSFEEVLIKKTTVNQKGVLYKSKHLNIFLTPISSEGQIQGVLIIIQDVTNI
jgi:PAS domain S-box-containing protein